LPAFVAFLSASIRFVPVGSTCSAGGTAMSGRIEATFGSFRSASIADWSNWPANPRTRFV
jgi:hypothetical protein